MKSGKLIVFEGIDNCGKDSAILSLQYCLRDNHNVKAIPSITNTKLGRLIRQTLIGQSDMRPNNAQLVPMFIADYYNKVNEIEEWKSQGYIVLCNRWYTTIMAYCDLSTSHMSIKNLIKTDIVPDILFYMDITVKESIRRGKIARKPKDVYDNEFTLKMAKEAYDEIFTKDEERGGELYNTRIINGMVTRAKIMDNIRVILKDRGIVNVPKKIWK